MLTIMPFVKRDILSFSLSNLRFYFSLHYLTNTSSIVLSKGFGGLGLVKVFGLKSISYSLFIEDLLTSGNVTFYFKFA